MSFSEAIYLAKCRHSSVGSERLICNQQVVGSNPTAGSSMSPQAQAEFTQSRKNCLDLSGEPIEYSVDSSSCALHNVVCDILSGVRSTLRHVGCPVDGARLNAAHGDGDGEDDRKERFHSTIIFVTARSYALIRIDDLRDALALDGSLIRLSWRAYLFVRRGSGNR
jgi:hypothetical protein